MMKFLAMVWLECLRNFWSNLRWCTHRKDTTKEIPTVNADNLNSTLREVYNNFEWTMDDWTQLFDSMRPAPYVYNLYFGAENTKTDFKDDCDGFHTVIYHILKNNGYDVALITVATKPIKNSHTMCAIKEKIEENGVEKTVYRIVDYTSLRGPYTSLQDFVDDYRYPVRYWKLDQWDYNKKKFRKVSKKEF